MSPAVINILISSKWERKGEDLFVCTKCQQGKYAMSWQLVIITNGLHNSTTTVNDAILCNKCYHSIKRHDNV